jgi:hypothetical protein
VPMMAPNMLGSASAAPPSASDRASTGSRCRLPAGAAALPAGRWRPRGRSGPAHWS